MEGFSIFESVFIPPAPPDAGTAVGAAIYACLKSGVRLDRESLGIAKHTYLGSGLGDTQIERDLERTKQKYRTLDSPAGRDHT